MKALTFNVQSLRELENENGNLRGPFPELTFTSRWPMMKDFFSTLIKEQGIEIFTLQEVGPDAEQSISEYFKSIGYACTVAPYCLDKEAFRFITAYDPKKYCLIGEVIQIPYTKTGKFLEPDQRKALSRDEIKKHNLDVDYEKSALVMTLQDLATNEMVKVYSTHPGLTNDHRLACMEILAEKIAQDKKEGFNVVVAGDMNQFDMDVSQPKILESQPEKLTSAGLTWLNKDELLKKGAQATFMAYAYDIMRFITKDEKAYLFDLNDRAKELKKKLITQGEDPSNNAELQGIYLKIREFYQTKQDELLKTTSGAGLSTVLDFIGVLGPLFQQQQHTVDPIIWHHGRLFNTANVASRSDFEAELQAANNSGTPLVSDHFALHMHPA